MTLFACWVWFPAVVGLAALGHGLLLQRMAGARMPGALVLPAGLALIVVIAEVLVTIPGTAKLAPPVIVLVAVAGIVLERPWRARHDLDLAAVAAGLGAFAVYAAPVVLSGEATFAGYIKLDDGATFLALADRAIGHGRDLGGLAPSSYRATLDAYMANGYPLGSLLPLAALRPLTGQDLAWVYQPWLAFLASMIALAGYTLARSLLRPWPAAAAALVAASSSLLFGYAMWGGVKEVATAWLIVTMAAQVPALTAEGAGLRAIIPLAVTVAATIATVTIGGGVYIAPILLLALAVGLAARRREGRLASAGWQVGAFAAIAVVASIPALGTAKRFLETAGALTTQTELGNLVRPLRLIQVFGVWPADDFRIDPHAPGLTRVLIAVVLIGAVTGLVFAVRRRAWGVLAYALGAGIGGAVLALRGSPWVDGKSLAIVSPAALLLGLIGLGAAAQTWRSARPALTIATVAVGAAVLVGNALAYHQTFLAPRDRLAELQQIGELVKGRGPTLLPASEVYASRHFLRDGDGESASDLRVRPVELRQGGVLTHGSFADLDAFQLPAVVQYRSLVVPRSPQMSRPPATYQLVSSGRAYNLWQRPARGGAQLLQHMPLGDATQSTRTPECAAVQRLALQARRAGAVLAAPPRAPATFLPALNGSYPAAWGRAGGTSGLAPWTSGTLRLRARLPQGGRRELYLNASLAGRADVFADGRRVGTATGLTNGGVWASIGTVALGPGAHVFEVRYHRSKLSPGTGVPLAHIDTLALGPPLGRQRVEYVEARGWRSLCGRDLDWVEVVKGVPRGATSR